jgi:hypothetical protein
VRGVAVAISEWGLERYGVPEFAGPDCSQSMPDCGRVVQPCRKLTKELFKEVRDELADIFEGLKRIGL